MAKRYDAAIKHLVEAHPGDWLAFARLPPATALEVVDADVSSVSPAADKVVRVSAPVPYVAHLEFQSGPDPELDGRVLLYNVLLRWRHRLPVWSVVFLLRPQARSGVSGTIRDSAAPDQHLEFRYRLVSIWEQPVDSVLAGGLGTLPLAPITDVAADAVPRVLEQMQQRLALEASPGEVPEVWAAAAILMGLRYPREVLANLLKGVRAMKESVTYQMILEEGEAKGRAAGRTEGRTEGRAEGRAEEARALLIRLASKRLGPPPQAASVALASFTDIQRMEALIERLLEVSSWDEILADLK